VTARTSVGIAQDVIAGRERDQFAADLRYYLVQHPRQLPSRYLYDALGSALFEAICHLPWYGITRAESRLLAAHAPEILRRLESLSAIVELGPGSGKKLCTLLQGAGDVAARLDVHLVDVSPTALQAARETLGSVAGVRVIEHAASYEAGLADASRQTTAGGRSLVLFLGSNIGNFDPPGAAALLRSIRQTLTGGDALLLGADLVKPARQLRLAYDDPLGVTAAFNRNLLVRINRELRGDFTVEEFAHEAVWNLDASRVEMHLVALSPQHVEIPAAGLEITFEAGERIWTESSYKYHPDQIVTMLRAAGFRVAEQWIEPDAAFALTLGEAR
jgi:L-histidine Nalpha-methyltransferase